jgi:26S proteasome regulatory subunit N10
MVLEACMMCTDNSDYMRNGDFAPSRLEAQQDAVNLLAGAKTQQNPENTVGVLTMAGKGVDVRVALTADVGKVLSLSHGTRLHGEINLSAGIQVAQLALKHRLNKNQRQRIIVFVGSPIQEEEAALVPATPLDPHIPLTVAASLGAPSALCPPWLRPLTACISPLGTGQTG